MVKRRNASRGTRAEPMPTRTLGITAGRTSGDEWLEITTRLRDLNASATKLGNQLADLLEAVRQLPI